MNEVETIKQSIREAESANLPLWRGQNELANWHLRQGGKQDLERARSILLIALSQTDAPNGRAVLTATLARTYCQAGKHGHAIESLNEFDTSQITDGLVLAKFQHTKANVLDESGDYDDALVELAGAGAYFELAGHPERAEVQANTASVYVKIGKPEDAHPELDKAEAYYLSFSDYVALAQVQETRARAYLAENITDKALAAINKSLSHLSDETPLIVESLITKGRILARMKQVAGCAAAYSQAIELLKGIEQETASVEFEMNDALLPIVEWNRKRLALVLAGGKKKAAAERLGVKPEAVRLWVKADPTLEGDDQVEEVSTPQLS